VLAGVSGRPAAVPDGGCLARLAGMGLAQMLPGERYGVTEAGRARHAAEVG